MKRFGKLITLVLVVAMALSLMSVAALAADSSDYKDVVAGKWYVKYVDWALDKGLMTGISDTEWAPNTATTRGMVITTLYALAGKPEVEGDSPFADVEEGKYYTDAVKWAVKAGVASGKSSDSFKPNDVLTRQEAATFFCAYAKNVMGLDVSDVSGLNKFPDNGDVSNYAKDAMGWAVKANVISGSKEDGVVKLMPKRNITRAELATMLKALSEIPVPTSAPDKIGYGTVVVKLTASDKAVKGVEFSLTGSDNDANVIERTAVTNAQGEATFKDVPASGKDGYSIVATNADARYGKQSPVTGVAVKPDETTTVDYALKEQGGNVTVVVTATEEAQKARALVDGVYVTLVGKTYDGQRYSRTLATEINKDTKNGEVTFKNVPAGEYSVQEIWETAGDQAGNERYNQLQNRYKTQDGKEIPLETLVADEQTFAVENEDVSVTQTLKVYDPTAYYFIDATVSADEEQAELGWFKSLAGYQFLVTGESKDGEKINIASNYTNPDGFVKIKVPESKKGTKYTVTLLNAPSYVTVEPKDVKVAVTEDVSADFVLTMKTSSVEVKLVDIDTGKVVRDTKATVNVYGKNADGVNMTATKEFRADNDGFVTLDNIPYSDENGYDIYVDDDTYAIAKTANVVVDSNEEKDIVVYVTKNWRPVDVELNVSQKDRNGKMQSIPNSDESFKDYKFKLVGKTAHGEDLEMTSLDNAYNDGVVHFYKVPYGNYKIYAIGLDDAQSVTVRVWNEVTLDETATTNNTVIVDKINTKSTSDPVIVQVEAVLKTAKAVRVHYVYRDTEIQDIETEMVNVETGVALTPNEVSTYDPKTDKAPAVFKYVPAGTYQITIVSDNESGQPTYVTDMFIYEVIQGQNTIVEVGNKEIDVYINLSRIPAPGATK